MGREDVRKNLSQADLVVATLVSGIEKTWRKIHRPAPCINFQEIIEGLRELAKAGDEKSLHLRLCSLRVKQGGSL